MSDLTAFRDHCRKMAAAISPERALWTSMADEIDQYLTFPTTAEDLFGDLTAEPTEPQDAADREEQAHG